MAPKKGKKIPLNEFLGDSTLGSWADEMDSLPSHPTARNEEEKSRGSDRYGRRDDQFSSRNDKTSGHMREDIPIPSQPPYTAFIGNLAFDLTESDLETFFSGSKTKSIKIIRDRDEKPKGFGYVEFEDVEALKDALAKSGSTFSGRTIRISVAEPPKERGGFSGGLDEDTKFDNPWRRDGPLPDVSHSRDPSRRRPDRPDRPEGPAASDGSSDWRASSRPRPEPDSSFKRKGSGFTDNLAGAADKEEVWTLGSKFKPSGDSTDRTTTSRFGSLRTTDAPAATEEGDWRGSKTKTNARDSVSPVSTPSTPQPSRRKLELLPRSGTASVSPSPLSSPKMGSASAVSTASRSNPFGNAKPVDVSAKDKEVTERLEKDREASKDRLTMSRTNSRNATERPGTGSRAPPALTTQTSNQSTSTSSPISNNITLTPNVRPSLSFANVAAKKESTDEKKMEGHITTENANVDKKAENNVL